MCLCMYICVCPMLLLCLESGAAAAPVAQLLGDESTVVEQPWEVCVMGLWHPQMV